MHIYEHNQSREEEELSRKSKVKKQEKKQHDEISFRIFVSAATSFHVDDAGFSLQHIRHSSSRLLQ